MTAAETAAALTALSVPPRWTVDADLIGAPASELCANDWDHGPALVYGGPCEAGLCGPCAVVAVLWVHSDPHAGTWLGMSLDVLSDPAETAVAR